MIRLLMIPTIVVMLLAGCATTERKPEIKVETQIVQVPVKVARTPPPDLLAPVKSAPLPVFVSPADPKATSALTAEGEKRLKILLNELLTRIEAWKAWATSPDISEQPVFFIGWRSLDYDDCLAMELNANYSWEGFSIEIFGYGITIVVRPKAKK